MKTVIGIGGTTCVGKSAVAVCLAKMLGTEVVSADSMQIYKGMDVGTAKISPREMGGVPHHMLDVALPCDDFSSFEYQASASKIIDAMTTVPVVVGGTGFYFDSLVYPPEFGTVDKARRQELQNILRTQGLDALCEILCKLDADAHAAVDLKNPVRVMRAIEIAECGESRAKGSRNVASPRYDLKMFVLQRDRQSLYKMIDARVDDMFEKGLVAEVQALVEKYGVCDTSAFSAIGYKEVVEYLRGRCTKEQAVAQIKLNTRHYAKRQISYFKRMNVVEFVDVDNFDAPEAVAKHIFEQLSSTSVK